ncbi:MAG TPA: hypothetical protein PLS49_01635 [Candidatus Woesebacteria bacterium]|nr:hypothetical protein [Candidatus Woesebacteria bacterium]
MNKPSTNTQFAALFKKYRLRSEIETLAEFGDLLAQEGIVYEDSLFAKWQKGERVPSDRKIILTIIRLFIKLGGIQTIQESNIFFKALNQQNLSTEEQQILYDYKSLDNDLNIFLYASPLSDKFDNNIDLIYQNIQNLGYIHLNNEPKKHRLRALMKKIDNGEDEHLMEYKKIIQGFVENIKTADICIFETSFKSLGTGYLIHHALTLAKPTIILYYKENKPHIFSAVVDENLILKSYNESNREKVLERVLNVAKGKIK